MEAVGGNLWGRNRGKRVPEGNSPKEKKRKERKKEKQQTQKRAKGGT